MCRTWFHFPTETPISLVIEYIITFLLFVDLRPVHPRWLVWPVVNYFLLHGIVIILTTRENSNIERIASVQLAHPRALYQLRFDAFAFLSYTCTIKTRGTRPDEMSDLCAESRGPKDNINTRATRMAGSE